MISYADMLTLLLAVFIVLFAEATVNQLKLKQEAQSLFEAFQGTPPNIVQAPSNPNGPETELPSPIPKPVASVQAPPGPAPVTPVTPVAEQILPIPDQRDLQSAVLAIKEINRKLTALLAQEVAENKISIIAQPTSITIRLNAKILFRSADATLTPEAVQMLSPIADVLSAIPPGYLVTVQGFTDSNPIKSARYSSNWELSTARAVSVVELFETKKVADEALSAQGFSKNRPIAPNDTEAGRSQNRRVEIVITAPKPQSDAHEHTP
jgi:chemotaxis protein MotB